MLAIGLMSGTSLDGVDASLIETDGEAEINLLSNIHIPYPAEFQKLIRGLLRSYQNWFEIEKELTDYHAVAVKKILKQSGLKNHAVKVIGFHGQTVYHQPAKGITWQIGNPHSLAYQTGIDVVGDFRRRDVALGGQGAPLLPVFHRVLMRGQEMPVAVLNIGGVANITYVDNQELIAFDTGPGNALINDVTIQYFNQPYDNQGTIAAGGKVDFELIEEVLNRPFFSILPPKSVDRNEFIVPNRNGMRKEDLIATLCMLTVKSISKGLELLPRAPKKVYVCGGGVKNLTMVKWLSSEVGDQRVQSINSLGLEADFIEAQGFGYMAVRYLKSLPSSFPSTTGVSQETLSGVLFPA